MTSTDTGHNSNGLAEIASVAALAVDSRDPRGPRAARACVDARIDTACLLIMRLAGGVAEQRPLGGQAVSV